MTTYDDLAREALETLDGHMRTDRAREIWQVALQSRHEGPPVWFHGDMDQTNLLVQEGSLAAVIDFGTCGVGDPACDLAIAWTLLTGDARTAFRRGLSVDDDTWDRGRGWALWKTLVTCAGCLDAGGPELEAATYVLDEIIEEYRQTT